jgi:hypothetical protein
MPMNYLIKTIYLYREHSKLYTEKKESAKTAGNVKEEEIWDEKLMENDEFLKHLIEINR